MENIYIFQYDARFNKTTFSNIDLLNKVLLIVAYSISQTKYYKNFALQFFQFRKTLENKLPEKLFMLAAK